jgi:hypothetical protein
MPKAGELGYAAEAPAFVPPTPQAVRDHFGVGRRKSLLDFDEYRDSIAPREPF